MYTEGNFKKQIFNVKIYVHDLASMYKIIKTKKFLKKILTIKKNF